MRNPPPTPIASVILIGDEILSGRTQDKNLAHIASVLAEVGIAIGEARIIPDIKEVIISVVNDMRQRYDYVFTTGGIGPTHDDITAECMATAFGVALEVHPLAQEMLQDHYDTLGTDFNEARQRMARIPQGAALIDNPVSRAPGFAIENVYVMAGIPRIMQAMMEGVLPTLKGGEAICSCTITALVPEGTIAAKMHEMQTAYAQLNIGLYPFYGAEGAGVSVVARGRDQAALTKIETEILEYFEDIEASLTSK
ncbi:MAG: competence/damage-inducible protein A, partial [Alphaproteobacteria bacterium]|nr:competence/damage-inducible protein A [Alphaproteobacteria bacterium]